MCHDSLWVISLRTGESSWVLKSKILISRRKVQGWSDIRSRVSIWREVVWASDSCRFSVLFFPFPPLLTRRGCERKIRRMGSTDDLAKTKCSTRRPPTHHRSRCALLSTNVLIRDRKINAGKYRTLPTEKCDSEMLIRDKKIRLPLVLIWLCHVALSEDVSWRHCAWRSTCYFQPVDNCHRWTDSTAAQGLVVGFPPSGGTKACFLPRNSRKRTFRGRRKIFHVCRRENHCASFCKASNGLRTDEKGTHK